MSRSDHRPSLPPDNEARELILTELGQSMLVEAGAGAGKTTSMIGRMTALIRSGKCSSVGKMAAVTFTRKAASELRAKFRVALERAAAEADGAERDRLARAAADVDKCFIGTIHSFCARLLRERPVEARVDLAFQEMDDEADAALRDEAWNEFAARLAAGAEAETAAKLREAGLGAGDLAGAFRRFADFPDVDEWPAPEPADVDLISSGVAKKVLSYVDHMLETRPHLPDECGNDALIPKYKSVPLLVRHRGDMSDPACAAEVLCCFESNPSIVQKEWIKTKVFTGDDAKAEKARWMEMNEAAAPLLARWREKRYAAALAALIKAREIYDEARRSRGLLNFQDLLMISARLLRDFPHVRRYFARRWSHLLVDEFQDTDPIQAEVMTLLTASSQVEKDWRKCVPRPGSLFVVGDPKQSIYRFRRADVMTYNEVKKIIEAGGGTVVNLTANFRTTGSVIGWVNQVFGPDGGETFGEKGDMLRFRSAPSDESPAYSRLEVGRGDGEIGDLTGPFKLTIPKSRCGNKAAALEYETGRIARIIRDALDKGLTVTRSEKELAHGASSRVNASDFLIITRNTTNLSAFEAGLAGYGIPCRVTGGSSLAEIEEIGLLYKCLLCLNRPDDPSALVGLLRSELFGASDAALYEFKKGGGEFNFKAPPPEGLEGEGGRAIIEAFSRLSTYSEWLASMPAAAALERIASDLGLFALASARPAGDLAAGGLAKAVELARLENGRSRSVAGMADLLGSIASGEAKEDGIPATADLEPRVRIMNLHKAKGLEAPVVFLADASGGGDHPVTLHVDRSGGVTRGYMALYGESKGRGQGPLLAHSADWKDLMEKERGFLKAEELRLRYVAATRAGSALIVTQKGSYNGHNPWRFFGERLADAPEISDPEAQPPTARDAAAMSPEEAAEAGRAMAERYRASREPSIDSRGAKDYALSSAEAHGAAAKVRPADTGTGTSGQPTPFSESRAGESGPEWGSVIHQLLHLAARKPGADLCSYAEAILQDNDLDPSLASEALGVVSSVMASDVWRRAARAKVVLTEVPFQRAVAKDSSKPLLIKGVIDLAFREEDGWVVIDYKTDAVTEAAAKREAKRYAPQVELYKESLEACLGEKVKETGIYFTRLNKLVPVRDDKKR